MRKRSVQRVAAIHDLSGFGRASLTTIIPILSSMGVQVCPLPTAILSNHTGGFETFSYVDFTDYMQDYIDGWKKLNLDFDCIYSGFLGSERQIQIISDFIDDFGTEDNMVVVDPVLGDNGTLYSTMTQDHVSKMSRLVEKADIITPNFTEVSLLLGEPYEEKITDHKIKKWLKTLSDMGPEIVVATSVPDQGEGKDTNVVAFDRRSNTYWKIQCRYIPASYPGTGDAYTSVMIGSLLNGDSLPIALDKGVQFITQAIKASYGFDYPKREGVLLEKVLEVLNMPVVIGGYEMLEHDFINFPFACILMVACFIAGIILLVISIAIHTIQKDVEEHLALLFKEQMEFPKNKSGSMPLAGSQRHICCLKKYCYENEPFSLLRCIYR